jgi:hypothetical protein
MIRKTLLALSLVPALNAQGTTAASSPASFVPPSHNCVITVDMAALVETGLLEEMEANPMLGMFLAQAKAGMSMPMDAVKRARIYPDLPVGDEPSKGGIAILECSDAFKVPEGGREEKVGAYTMLVQEDGPAGGLNAWVDVAPGLKVMGSTEMLVPLLSGSQKPGAPDAALTALTRGKGNLVTFAVKMTEDMMTEDMPFNADAGMPPPESAAFCLRAVSGEDDEPRFSMSVRLRFGGEDGVAEQVVQMSQMQMGMMAKMPQMKPFKPMLDKLQMKAEGKDAVMSLELGSTREFVASIGSLVQNAMMMMMDAGGPGGGGR